MASHDPLFILGVGGIPGPYIRVCRQSGFIVRGPSAPYSGGHHGTKSLVLHLVFRVSDETLGEISGMGNEAPIAHRLNDKSGRIRTISHVCHLATS